MYSVVLMMALTTGGTTMDRGHHGGCCGEAASCGCEGGRHHGRHGGGCGNEAGCGSCGYAGSYGGGSTCGASAGCASCGYGYAPSVGCSTCASGVCSLTGGVRVVENEAPATIIVSLPADAKLTIDGEATTSTSGQRVFVSPNLPTGKEFHYTLKAETQVNGKAVVMSERVTVKAGEATRITLSAPTGVAAR